MAAQPTILTIGDYKETLIVVRSLGRAGCNLVVGEQAGQGIAYARHSRYTSEIWEHPDFDREDQLIQAVVSLLESRADIQYVLPIGDIPISCFARHWFELPELPRFLMPLADAVIRCQDKIEMYDCAVRLGVPTATYTSICDARDLRAATEYIGFPCVVKPRYSPKPFMDDQKALICESVRDFSEWSTSLPDYCPIVVQKFVMGSRRNCHFIAKSGHILAYFEQKVLRTDHSDGTGRGIHSVSVPPTPELFEYTGRLAKDLQYSGVGTAQFLFKEATQEACFLEINPRFDSTIALPYQCGFDIPWMALQISADSNTNAGLGQNYVTGKEIHWLLKDIFAAGTRAPHRGGSVRSKLGSVGQVFKSWWNSSCHMTFEWSDPMPTLRLCMRLPEVATLSPIVAAPAPGRSDGELRVAAPMER
jgi:D-aspartate ligase